MQHVHTDLAYMAQINRLFAVNYLLFICLLPKKTHMIECVMCDTHKIHHIAAQAQAQSHTHIYIYTLTVYSFNVIYCRRHDEKKTSGNQKINISLCLHESTEWNGNGINNGGYM